LIDDAKAHFKIKRNMPAIASLAQAWEVFFGACALSVYVYRPFFAADPHEREIGQLNDLHRRLHAAVKSFAWFSMRILVANLIIAGIRPATVAESISGIATLPSLSNEPSSSSIAGISDLRTRETVEGLMTLTVGRLRNNVVHKHAYRPKSAEVEPCLASEIR